MRRSSIHPRRAIAAGDNTRRKPDACGSSRFFADNVVVAVPGLAEARATQLPKLDHPIIHSAPNQQQHYPERTGIRLRTER